LAGFSRSAWLVALAWALASPAAGQVPAEVGGRVVRLAGPDTALVPGAEVVLHRVAASGQGPLDSVRVTAGGRFRFRFTADTASLYLLSVRHHGITYFSSPVAREPATRIDDILLIVADTSSAAPVAIAARSLVVSPPEPSGARSVVEVVEIANRGQQTRVAADSVPTLAVPLATGGSSFLVQDTDLSPDAVRIRDDTLLVFAPLPPGARMVILQYAMAPGVRRLALPPGTPVDTVQIMLPPGGLELRSGLAPVGEQEIDGRPYLRWMGPWSGDSAVVIAATGVTFRQETALGLLVGALGLGLAGLLAWTARRRRVAAGPGAAPGPRPAAELLEALARLDARFQGRREATAPEEWHRYEEERARLKAELERALASGRRPA